MKVNRQEEKLTDFSTKQRPRVTWPRHWALPTSQLLIRNLATSGREEWATKYPELSKRDTKPVHSDPAEKLPSATTDLSPQLSAPRATYKSLEFASKSFYHPDQPASWLILSIRIDTDRNSKLKHFNYRTWVIPMSHCISHTGRFHVSICFVALD